jgi:hypothetical protein
MVTAMSGALPVPDAPAVSVAGAIARLEAIAAALPAADGLACFNRMYLDVTRQVNSQLGQGFFADPAFMTQLDVAFANLYFAAAGTAGTPAAEPLAWRPLIEQRAVAGIEPVQFALAGMNAHLNHDLPIAMVSTCTALATAPGAGPHFGGLPEGRPAAGRSRAVRPAVIGVCCGTGRRPAPGRGSQPGHQLDHHQRPGPGLEQHPAAVGSTR